VLYKESKTSSNLAKWSKHGLLKAHISYLRYPGRCSRKVQQPFPCRADLARGATVTGFDSSAGLLDLPRRRLGPDTDLHLADLARLRTLLVPECSRDRSGLVERQEPRWSVAERAGSCCPSRAGSHMGPSPTGTVQ
jgi:hypothetical protein